MRKQKKLLKTEHGNFQLTVELEKVTIPLISCMGLRMRQLLTRAGNSASLTT